MLSGVIESEVQAMALEHKVASKVRARGFRRCWQRFIRQRVGAATAHEVSRSVLESDDTEIFARSASP